jgi:hypothetical protein
MSFFVARTVPGTGNLGGRAGADQIWQNLTAASDAGGKTWHAYLSQQAQGNTTTVNTRPHRTGTWYNAKGQWMATGNAIATIYSRRPHRLRGVKRGKLVPGCGVQGVQNQHDMLTGSACLMTASRRS